MPRCNSCNRINPTASKFCSDCGKRLPDDAPIHEVTPRITEPKPSGVIAYIMFSVGFFFLIMGWAALDTAKTSEDLAKGTIIEDDPFSNQLNENMRGVGYTSCIIGIVICFLCVIGLGLGKESTKTTIPDETLTVGNKITEKDRSKELAKQRNSKNNQRKPKTEKDRLKELAKQRNSKNNQRKQNSDQTCRKCQRLLISGHSRRMGACANCRPFFEQ